MKLLVSVIIPIFNSEEYLEETIQSVISQTYKNIEIILINDGSNDGSAEICKKYANIDNRIVYISKNNGGVVEARNLGIKMSKGGVILPVDSDDIIYKTYIEKAVKVFETNNVDIVYCDAELFGNKKGKWDLPEYSLKNMLRDNCIFVSALFRKYLWENVGGYKDYMQCSTEDYDFWLHLIEYGAKIYKIPEVLFKYRIRENSRSSKACSRKKIIIQNHKDLYRKNADLLYRKDILRYIEVELQSSNSFTYCIKLVIAYMLLGLRLMNRFPKFLR